MNIDWLGALLGSLAAFAIYIIQWIMLAAGWVIFSILPAFLVVYLGSLLIFGGGLLEEIKMLTREFLETVGLLIGSVVLYIVGFFLLGAQGTLIGGAIGAALATALVWRSSKSN